MGSIHTVHFSRAQDLPPPRDRRLILSAVTEPTSIKMLLLEKFGDVLNRTDILGFNTQAATKGSHSFLLPGPFLSTIPDHSPSIALWLSGPVSPGLRSASSICRWQPIEGA